MDAGEFRVKAVIDTKLFDKQIDDVKAQIEELEEIIENPKKFGLSGEKLKKANIDLEKMRNKLAGLQRQQLAEIEKGTQRIDLNFGKTIKTIAKMGLAIFGIRTAYSAIRSAINDVSRSNENVANTLTYAKTMMSTALEPVVIRIVDWLKQALAYINALFKAWFKRDLFAETNKNLKQANKQASALKKTLAGFDEMNILNSSSTGGGGGITSADLGLPTVEETGIFGWILNNKDTMLGIISAIAGALIALKLTGLDPIAGILGAILGYGIYEFISGLISYLNDPTWTNFGVMLEGLGITIATIGLLLQAFTASSGPLGLVLTGIGLVATAIGGLIQDLNKNETAIKNVQQANEDLATAKEKTKTAMRKYTDALDRETKAHEELIQAQKDTGLSGEELYRRVKQNVEIYKTFSEEEKRVFNAYVNEQDAMQDTQNALKVLNDAKQAELKADYEKQMSNDKTGQSYEELRDKIVKSVEEEKLSVKDAQELISKMMSTMSYDAQRTFEKDIPNSIKKGLNVEQYQSAFKNFKKAWADLFSGKITSELKLYYSSSGGNGKAKGGIYYPELPRLAVGGIVNQPGRGIPYHGAVIGERGAEAVVPLTDSQQMELLGATIGKYITINNTNPIYMNGRLIAKEINRSNAEDDFAFNR